MQVDIDRGDRQPRSVSVPSAPGAAVVCSGPPARSAGAHSHGPAPTTGPRRGAALHSMTAPTRRPGTRRFTSTEVVYGVTDPDVTGLPEYGVSP